MAWRRCTNTVVYRERFADDSIIRLLLSARKGNFELVKLRGSRFTDPSGFVEVMFAYRESEETVGVAFSSIGLLSGHGVMIMNDTM